MGYEIYRRGHHVNPRDTTAFVRISHGTRISFSKPCLDFFGDATHVLYLIDKDRKMAAIRPCREDEKGKGYSLHTNESQAYVSARAFLQTLGITDSGRIDAVIADGMLQFPYDKDVLQ